MFKKWMLPFVTAVATLATLAFSVVPAFAASPDTARKEDKNPITLTVGEKVTDQVGNAGIFTPKSGYNGELDLSRTTRMPGDHVQPAIGVKLVDRLLNVSVEKSKENNDAYLHGQTYIFFDLTRAQEQSFKNGELAIYGYNTSTRTWSKLPTFSVAGAMSRVSTVATGFGDYALGMPQ